MVLGGRGQRVTIVLCFDVQPVLTSYKRMLVQHDIQVLENIPTISVQTECLPEVTMVIPRRTYV